MNWKVMPKKRPRAAFFGGGGALFRKNPVLRGKEMRHEISIILHRQPEDAHQMQSCPLVFCAILLLLDDEKTLTLDPNFLDGISRCSWGTQLVWRFVFLLLEEDDGKREFLWTEVALIFLTKKLQQKLAWNNLRTTRKKARYNKLQKKLQQSTEVHGWIE